MSSEENLRVILSASEMSPFAKTGGLGDVIGSLPKALSNLGNIDVWTVIPKYRFIDNDRFHLEDIPGTINFNMSGTSYEVKVKYLGLAEGWKACFIENEWILTRDGIYGYDDDGYRFAFFARAVLEVAKALNFRPDVIHCNDWHTGLIPVYLKTMYEADPSFKDTATVFTVHNLPYRGIFSKELLPWLDIGWEEFKMEKLEFWDNICFLKGGIAYSDVINTVSKQYSKEIQTPEYGEGLDGLLRARKDVLYGITNGLDYDVWDPQKDQAIAKNYNVSSIENKAFNKSTLQEELGLPVAEVPLIGVVSRLSYQKGVDIIADSAHDIALLGAQLVVEGVGDEYYRDRFLELAYQLPNNVKICSVFDDPLARRIYAGSDMFLMPSRYEPCGLSQLIAMRYGAIPIVHRTGGLADTVKDYNSETKEGTGFCFDEASSIALVSAILRAVDMYNHDKDNWRNLVTNAMRADFSWKRSAQEYVDLYKRAIQNRRGSMSQTK